MMMIGFAGALALIAGRHIEKLGREIDTQADRIERLILNTSRAEAQRDQALDLLWQSIDLTVRCMRAEG